MGYSDRPGYPRNKLALRHVDTLFKTIQLRFERLMSLRKSNQKSQGTGRQGRRGRGDFVCVAVKLNTRQMISNSTAAQQRGTGAVPDRMRGRTAMIFMAELCR